MKLTSRQPHFLSIIFLGVLGIKSGNNTPMFAANAYACGLVCEYGALILSILFL